MHVKGFNFYGLGNIEPVATQDHPEPFVDQNCIILVQLTGEEIGYCVVGFPTNISDQSMACEMANVIASRMASTLTKETGVLVEISLPKIFHRGHSQFKSLVAYLNSALLYRFNSRTVSFLKIAYVRGKVGTT